MRQLLREVLPPILTGISLAALSDRISSVDVTDSITQNAFDVLVSCLFISILANECPVLNIGSFDDISFI